MLSSLLLDLTGLSDEEAEKVAYEEYVKLYMDRRTHRGMIGERRTHDDQQVTFFEDRFEHAFFSSSEGASRQYAKDKFQKSRASRIGWIGRTIKGDIEGTECWLIAPLRRYHSDAEAPARLYVVWEENYLVWLEPRRNGGWWFSSAYVADRGKSYIRSILNRGTLLWRKT
jgi:hypothetical protein